MVDMILRGDYPSPSGVLYYAIGERGLIYLSFDEKEDNLGVRNRAVSSERSHNDELGESLGRIERDLLRGLHGYFRERVWSFAIPLDYRGIPPLYRRIYDTLRDVGWGEVITYSELARKAGIGKGWRVVGRAMARNPFVIIVPCHRVVGKNSPGGFSAGISTKLWLLRHEGVQSEVLKAPGTHTI